MLEVGTDGAWTLVGLDLVMALVIALAGPRIGQTSPAQWRATHLASARWRYASAASATMGGVAGAAVLLMTGRLDLGHATALAGCLIAMALVVPGVVSASRAMTATRQAEDHAHMWRPTPGTSAGKRK